MNLHPHGCDGPAPFLLNVWIVVTDKAALRQSFAAAREDAAQSGDEAARRLALIFLGEGPEVRPGQVVAGYWPIRTEIDVRPLMDQLLARGITLALPSAKHRDGTLLFGSYEGGIPPARDVWGIPAPDMGADELVPDVVLVPGLGFDVAGHRLGYGAGNYDRALAGLRESGTVTAVGVGFDAQVVEKLPREDHDMVLDWVVTPGGVAKRP